MKFLAVVSPSPIYHGLSTRKKSWEEMFTLVNMKSCGCRNVIKHKEIKNGEKYIALEIYLKLDCLDKREFCQRCRCS